MTVLSTTSGADLSVDNNELVQFSKALPGVAEERHLAHEFKWFIGSKSGCSCEFRHLHVSSVELGFGEPEDWFPEEASDIDATRQVLKKIRSLVAGGGQVDCVDAWASDNKVDAPLAGETEVDLYAVSDAQFRFFEMHRFTFITHPHLEGSNA